MGTAATIMVIALYGGLVLGGGVLWLMGHMLGKKPVARAGEVTVLVGLCLDVLLLVCQWLFDLIGWMAA